MLITSKFTTGMISKIMTKILQKQLGYDVDIELNEVKMTVGEQIHIHVDVDAKISKEEILKILKNTGLD